MDISKHLREAIKGLSPSFESSVVQELEYCLFAKLRPGTVLTGPCVTQTQASMLTTPTSTERIVNVQFRVRRTEYHDNPTTYEQTVKIRKVGVPGVTEVNVDVTSEAFDAVAGACDQVLKKRRFSYPVPGTELVWEVDQFETEEGWCDWVKLDLEVKAALDSLPALPVDFEEVIHNPKSPEHQPFIDKLFKSFNRLPAV